MQFRSARGAESRGQEVCLYSGLEESCHAVALLLKDGYKEQWVRLDLLALQPQEGLEQSPPSLDSEERQSSYHIGHQVLSLC